MPGVQTLTSITAFDGTNLTSLVNGLVGSNSGIAVDTSSIVLTQSGQGAVNFYDGSLSTLGIGAGLLLTSGTTPGESNTLSWFGADNSSIGSFANGDPAIDAVVNTVFQTQSFDATSLEFSFTATDPNALSVSFDLVFGSDEYPEWVDLFVDCAIVSVNGVNYAYFNHDPNAPLSVISSNLAAGYFMDNAGNQLQIEYDGVSHVLKIIAPINPGVPNHIKIGIADTGDHILDSGIFISNMQAGYTPGSGVVSDPDGSCTNGSDVVSGTAQSEIFDLIGGDDTVYAAGGDDIIVGGGGADVMYGGSGSDVIEGDDGADTLDGGEGIDTAVFWGNHSDYHVTVTSDGIQVSDLGGDSISDGTDILTGVELLQFKDGVYQVNSDGSLSPVSDAGGSVNAPGIVVVTGLGVPGKTLSANVSDIDGISGSVSYTWQSSTDGLTWSDIVGASASSYSVADADAGSMIRVVVAYEDGAANQEVAASAALAVYTNANGDLHVNLPVLSGPPGSSVITPLTTLIQACIDLGLSPNMAQAAVKAALGLPSDVSLQSYNALEVLQSHPADATALHVEMVSVQVAILTSLSDDDHAYNLALHVIEAAAAGVVLDLASEADLSLILDVSAGSQALAEILDRNASMSDGVADGGGLAAIEQEWQDLLSLQDGIASTSISDLTVHVNQTPVGTSTSILASGTINTDYLIDGADLLAGFSDPEGLSLTVSGLTSDSGTIIDNGDGTFTFTPATDFTGPVELTYYVEDPEGAILGVSQLLVISSIDPSNVNQAPVVSNPIADQSTTEGASFTFQLSSGTITDPDVGDTLTYSALLSNGSALPSWLSFDAATQTFSGSPGNGDVGTISVTVTATDGSSATVSDTFDITVADTNNAPVITSNGGGASASLSMQENGASVTTVVASDSDAGATLTYSIVGGADAAAFNINAGSGALTFVTAPNFEAPTDVGANNVYDVIVQVSDGNETDTQAIAVTVTNQSPETVVGTAADETFLAGADIELVNGQLGIDTVSYQLATAGVVASLSASGSNTGYATSDTYLSIENLIGTSFNDTLTGDGGSNQLVGGLGADNLSGLAGDDRLDGGDGADTLNGGDGNDVLAGAAGNDILTGGAGIDTVSYADVLSGVTVNLALATAQNTAGAGTDTISQVENLIGSAFNDILTGSSNANRIEGGAGDDIIMILAAADHATGEVIQGGDGTDELRFASTKAASLTVSADTSVERIVIGTGTAATAVTTGTAAINVNASALSAAISLTGNAGANILVGGAGNDTLTGNAGNDTLNGGAGDDMLIGGVGNDTYVVTELGDMVVEAPGAGTDLVQVAIAAAGGVYTLTADVENATLTNTVAYGLVGNSLTNALTGNGAANTLDGGGGTDKLVGGAGDDTYIVDLTSAGLLQDTITEAASAGTDLIQLRGASTNTAAATITAGANLENLDASATGSSLLNLAGNALANTITGNAAINVITGGASGDTMDGRGGSDIYLVATAADYAGDVISDTGLGLGEIDELRFAATTAGTLTVSASTSGLERIVIGTGAAATAVTTGTVAINVDASALSSGIALVGNAGANSLSGGSGSDTLTGNAGNDALIGGQGDDRLLGGVGNDTLTGGAGSDTFVFDTTANATTNLDRITDFNVTDDTIQLENAIFTGLGLTTGALSAAAFSIGTAAGDVDDRIIYNSSTGALYYDGNGNAAGGSVQIATLSTGLALTSNDFWII